MCFSYINNKVLKNNKGFFFSCLFKIKILPTLEYTQNHYLE